MNAVSLIIVAAGRSVRMGAVDKLFLPLGDKPLLQYSIEAFLGVPDIAELILVLSEHNLSRGEALLATICGDRLPYQVVCGGASRQQSALAGFSATNPAFSWVAIHDGARPLVEGEQILAVLAAAKQRGAALLGVPISDTIKRAASPPHPAGERAVAETLDREHLFAIQTPQVFQRDLYAAAMTLLQSSSEPFTDDASIVEQLGHPVQIVIGSPRNLKVTTPDDLSFVRYYLDAHQGHAGSFPPSSPPSEITKQDQSLQASSPSPPLPPVSALRVGQGYDVHRLVPGRPLVLGGVTIPHPMGLLGHSDADVLVHAVMDALLGAAALRDIGTHFPDTDGRFQGINSLRLLEQVTRLLQNHRYHIVNIDATIIAQQPKLAPYLPQMVQHLATACQILPEQVNVKATTEETLGFTGKQEGMSASAVVLLARDHD